MFASGRLGVSFSHGRALGERPSDSEVALTRPHRSHRRWLAVAGALAVIAAALIVHIDDWTRDFVSYEAVIAADSGDSRLAPLVSDRPADDLALALRWAAFRIPDWELVGESTDGNTTLVLFVRTKRLLRLKDDIAIRIEDRGGRRVVTGESRSRLHIGDLGRNPRNLHRILTELRSVLEGADVPRESDRS